MFVFCCVVQCFYYMYYLYVFFFFYCEVFSLYALSVCLFIVVFLLFVFSYFEVHPLRMTTTSSSTLKVGFTVAEEANAWEALSATKLAWMNRIRNWAEHCSMLMSVSGSCNTIVFIVKI